MGPLAGGKMLDVSFGGALLAGIVSFISPCVLPIVPPYLAYVAGLSFDEMTAERPAPALRRRIMLSASAFVLGGDPHNPMTERGWRAWVGLP